MRLLIESNGAWVVIAIGGLGHDNRLVLDVPQIIETARDNLPSLKSTQIRVELLSPQGAVVASSVAPVNVDCAHQFCGTDLVGPAMATLDEQIAAAGCGMPLTYRQQLDFIGRLRSGDRDGKAAPEVLTHQADLDRFFRNLQTGFRGIRARLRALPNSEFTARRTLHDLTRWCRDTVDREEGRLSVECRIFLVDRLLREIHATLESCEKSRTLAPKVKAIARESRLAETLASASRWLSALRDRRVRSYVADTARLLASVSKRIEGVEGG